MKSFTVLRPDTVTHTELQFVYFRYEFTETDAVALGPQSDPWQITSVSRLAGPEGLEVIVGVKQGFIYRLRWGNLATAHLACEVRRRGGSGREREVCVFAVVWVVGGGWRVNTSMSPSAAATLYVTSSASASASSSSTHRLRLRSIIQPTTLANNTSQQH